jgi:hypothetical protein
MLMRHTSRRGLGADYRINSSGTIVDCDAWSSIVDLVCWGAPTGQLPVGTSAGDSASNLPVDTGCSSTIITSPIAVCDWILYTCGAVVAGLLLMAMMGARR